MTSLEQTQDQRVFGLQIQWNLVTVPFYSVLI